MYSAVRRPWRRFVLLLLFLSTFGLDPSAATAEGWGEFSGFVAADARLFAQDPALPGQSSGNNVSFVLQPEWRLGMGQADALTVVGFARLDFEDDERTHFDLREAYWRHTMGDLELRVGLDKVYWGVAESRHLVDVINQTDLVEDLDQEDKLGQPMIHLTLLRDWGTWDLFLMSGFRERTFPGLEGRLRSPLPVEVGQTRYKSDLDGWQPEVALRYAHTLGDLDFGVSHFYGTSREPRFEPRFDQQAPVLTPVYDLIHQSAIDAQLTREGWLWKLELMTRSGQGSRFLALVAGVEYTLFDLGGSGLDVGLLAEFLYDDRGADAPPTPFEHDLFAGTRIAFNDVQDTQVLAGLIVDPKDGGTNWNLEATRRVGQRWRAELELRAFTGIPPDDLLSSISRDDYLQIRLARYF